MSCLRATTALLLLLIAASPVGAELELTASGYEITAIVVAPRQGGGLAAPAAGASMNSSGDVLFSLAEAAGGNALYLRYNIGLRVRILGAGDALAGSTVTRLVSTPSSLDEYRQMLVYAELADGREGLFKITPPPSPFAVTPRWGNRAEPISFHLLGDGFTPGVEVFFGDVKAGLVTVISRTELSGIIPAGAPAGVVDVTVARPSGAKGRRQDAFEFRDPPAAGCRGLWPDHRPPQRTSALGFPWLVAAAATALRRRRRQPPWGSCFRRAASSDWRT